jgi:hypothetical protein
MAETVGVGLFLNLLEKGSELLQGWKKNEPKTQRSMQCKEILLASFDGGGMQVLMKVSKRFDRAQQGNQ